jgi:hypothetical protein
VIWILIFIRRLCLFRDAHFVAFRPLLHPPIDPSPVKVVGLVGRGITRALEEQRSLVFREHALVGVPSERPSRCPAAF